MSVHRLLTPTFILTFLGGYFLTIPALEDQIEAPWTTSLATCLHRLKSVDSVQDFLQFAKESTNTESKQEKVQITKTINDCLHSVDGEGDISAMNKIVEQLPTIHSVCESEFIDQLFKFTKRMRDNGTSRKNPNGLLRFYTLFTGQIILTCKRNLEKKLEQAEQSDEALRQSLDVIVNDESIRPSFESLMPRRSSNVDLPENIVLTAAIKARLAKGAYASLTLDSKEMVDLFSRIKRACKLIDSYAQNSIHPMTRFAMVGLKAGDDNDVTNTKLKSSSRIFRWINAVQYCQGFSLVKAVPHCFVPESFRHDISDEEQTKIEWKRFVVDDKFEDIGWDLHCSVHPPDPKARGLKSLVLKRSDKTDQTFA